MERIQYAKSLCFFIDILGYSNLVESDNYKLQSYIQFVKFTKSMIGKESKSMYKFMALSDSLFMSVELGTNQEKNRQHLRYLCELAAIIQYQLCTLGLWSRGGLTGGELYFDRDEDIILGKAFNRAINLEKQAEDPKVIIDNTLVDMLGYQSVRELIETTNKLKGFDYQGNFGDVIFDYKRINIPGAIELARHKPMFVDFASPINVNIEAAKEISLHLKEDIKGKIEFFKKYQWLVNYLTIKFKDISMLKNEFEFTKLAKEIEDLI